ncbi:methionyl-tRNA formyltransferase [Hoyosella rhizosphaerae]|uniref:Methionyl-tRNA formyltransferase n=1 Tax=Hoyosella rhizosphaerae TaxID=1755582 RepID=A0A916U540_9ACTN|nr:methionyl-tRNA formyltransferase [Hoyosella rhizosphaerae]MBN4926470.1 methionyl-tRNA formyltransferase [Hoyosella rhizosphaerae]GGC59104.1 methionyl-tRNA formyltransferase [Hoyosella rhizosphaerae]
MRLVFAGTPDPAAPALQRLIECEQHDVVAVVTRPDAAAGRGRRTQRSSVAQLADSYNIPVLTPQRPSDPEFVAALQALEPDCCPVVAYGALLTKEVIAIPRYGWVNLHFSLLPAWRGAAPVQASIAAGDDMTGATTFRIDEGLDTGPVFGVVTETVRPDDTAGVLLDRLALSGALLLERTMDGIENGTLTAVPQTSDGVSYAPKISVDAARVDWSAPAFVVDRHIRAMSPMPGAWTTVSDMRLKITSAGVADNIDAELAPGQVHVTKKAVFVGTGSTPIKVATVQQQGKKTMVAADWARGARLSEEVQAQ